MTPRHHLNRFLEAVAIPHLALYIVVGQVLVFGLMLVRPQMAMALPLVPELVLHGEWWRIFAYYFVPPSSSPVWCVVSWMMLYFVINTLESHWGTVKLNLYIFTGWMLTTTAAFLLPAGFAVSYYALFASFLAFAFIAPELEMMVFFVLPVKVKWLALAQWLWYAIDFSRGPFGIRVSIGAAVATFVIFFGREIVQRVRGQGRRVAHAQRMRAAEPEGPRHTCVICGKNSNTHPDLDFRYCSKCAGEQCYCPDHIRNHEHVRAENDASPGQP